jgi:hypothetical protein
LCSSPQDIRIVKTRILVGHTAHIREKPNTRFLGQPEGKNRMKDPGVKGKIPLKKTLKRTR